MLVPIVCITCGAPIGDVADVFRALRAELTREALDANDVSPAMASADDRMQISCQGILDELGLTEICCRTHLSTAMEFNDWY